MNNRISRAWLVAIAACLTCAAAIAAPVAPQHLLVEGHQRPLNVHNTRPRLSWRPAIAAQDHYQIQVARSKSRLLSGDADLWDSGKVASKQSVNVPYLGVVLDSGDSAFWRVRVWPKGARQPGRWSDPGSWEMGMLDKADWRASWIQVEHPLAAEPDQALEQWIAFAANVPVLKDGVAQHVIEKLIQQPTAALFRHEFKVAKPVVKARLHSTAAGYYEIYINGRRIGDRIMDPGQTDYEKRILYNTDDVTSLVSGGANTIAVHLGSGWYHEGIAFSKPDKTLSYGQPKFIAQLALEYADGSRELVSTNGDWLSHPSPVLKEGLFSGEFYDSARVVEGWNLPESVSESRLRDWNKAAVLQHWPTDTLQPQLLPPIRRVSEVQPERIYSPQDGVWVVDFGQNFTGAPTLNLAKLQLKDGQAVHLRYAEWADQEGNISQKTGGSAPLLKQVDTYVASSGEAPYWTPSFTWHGFRYIEITGLSSAPADDAITAHLIRSDVDRTGTFVSSDPLLNKIHDMALWSYESNLVSVPMDCPIRERAGWTGDAHAALVTGNYNFNMQGFWEKYLGDFQTSDFAAPNIVPGRRVHSGNFDWAVAEILIAWEHYRHHGDKQVLARQYANMLEYMAEAENNLDGGLLRVGYGDWCDPVRTPGTPREGGRCTPQQTSPAITSSALFAHAADLMGKMSSVLDEPENHKKFAELFDSIRRRFHSEFYDPITGHYGSQTADAMALRFGMAPIELRQSIAEALNRDVVENWGGHASVGALGQTYLYLALSDYGYADTAFNIFKAEGYPGYGYLFDTLNATTLWERKGHFDPTADPNGQTAPGHSLNHPFHSGYDGWFYEGLGGIRPLENTVGYQEFALRPNFVRGLEFVKVTYTTGYGEIKSHWQRDTDTIRWDFEIPENSMAWVTLPGKKAQQFNAGYYSMVIENESWFMVKNTEPRTAQ